MLSYFSAHGRKIHVVITGTRLVNILHIIHLCAHTYTRLQNMQI